MPPLRPYDPDSFPPDAVPALGGEWTLGRIADTGCYPLSRVLKTYEFRALHGFLPSIDAQLARLKDENASADRWLRALAGIYRIVDNVEAAIRDGLEIGNKSIVQCLEQLQQRHRAAVDAVLAARRRQAR